MTVGSHIAVAVVIVTSFAGCREKASESLQSPATPDVSATLTEGNQALREMQDAAAQREYARYFENYETLRACYIEAAQALENSPSPSDATDILDTLAEWERMIEVARDAWDNAGNSLVPLSPEINDPARFSSGLTEEMQNLLREGEESQKKKAEEWAPVEAQLDAAMEKVNELRHRHSRGSGASR